MAEGFSDALHKQIANEFAAAQQYTAAAVYYDDETLPQLAAFFYRQASEERTHGMMMVQYLLDTGHKIVIPGVDAPKTDFADIVAPVSMALEQERTVTGEINALFKLARETGDFQSEQFMTWFVKEQVEEVKTMSDLLQIVERAKSDPLHVEEFLGRGGLAPADEDVTAPPAAGEGV